MLGTAPPEPETGTGTGPRPQDPRPRTPEQNHNEMTIFQTPVHGPLVSPSPAPKVTQKGPIKYDFGPTILIGKKRKTYTVNLSPKRVRGLLYITVDLVIISAELVLKGLLPSLDNKTKKYRLKS